MSITIFLFMNLLASCVEQPKAPTATQKEPVLNYQWQKMTDAAAFPESYNFQLFAVKDTLWAMHPRGTYFSIDGKDWQKTQLTHFIQNSAFLDFIYFKGALYSLGTFSGNIERYDMTGTIAKTTDFENWEIITKESNLPRRFFYHPFVFDDKIWIIGGNDGKEDYNDIWNSTDAVHWTKVKHDAAFGKRSGSQIVQLNGKLFLLDNDVWSSSDGINWTLVTPEIVKGQRIFGYAAVVYDNRIFLLGCNRNGQFTSKVLSSADGKNWQEMDAPWSPRGGIGACVFKDKIIMTGGKYGGTPEKTEFVYSNDVWTLAIK
ncbi:MAG: hypothetical protein ACK4TA_11655 [Saprospiraceae bacterium]